MATGTQLILSHTGSGGIDHTQNDCVPKNGTNVTEGVAKPGWAWKNLYYINKIIMSIYIYMPHIQTTTGFKSWWKRHEKTWKNMKKHLFRTVERQFLTTRNCGNESDELARSFRSNILLQHYTIWTENMYIFIVMGWIFPWPLCIFTKRGWQTDKHIVFVWLSVCSNHDVWLCMFLANKPMYSTYSIET